MTEEKPGKFRISDSSFRYFELPPDDPERQKILRAAALRPAVFKELINRHKDGVLPSDAALRSYLVLEKSFNPNTVEDFIRVFRQTIAIAKPFDAGYTEPPNEDSVMEVPPVQPPTSLTPPNAPVKGGFVPFRKPEEFPVNTRTRPNLRLSCPVRARRE